MNAYTCAVTPSRFEGEIHNAVTDYEHPCLGSGLFDSRCWYRWICFVSLTFCVPALLATPLQQSADGQGLVSIEAENYDANVTQGEHAWTMNTTSGYSGTGSLWASPNKGTTVNQGYVTNSPRLDYQINFVATGTHYLWVRAVGATKYDDSLHAGLDGNAISSSDRITGVDGTTWVWSRTTMDGPLAVINVKTPGLHVVNVWMRGRFGTG